MDFRKTFDAIPEAFDQWRPRYCDELFQTVTDYAGLDVSRSVLELGPGTGQATEPFLKNGCDYTAIELGENFTAFMKNKFGSYSNFHIIHDDYEKHDFGEKRFDLVFSAATIQWLPEEIAFAKTFSLLKNGGALAMFMTRTDEKTPNGPLYDAVQDVYRRFFRVERRYTRKLDYNHTPDYGFTDFHYMDWHRTRVYNAEEYAAYLAATQVEHITLLEPYRTLFFDGVRDAVRSAGDRIVLDDTIALYLARRP